MGILPLIALTHTQSSPGYVLTNLTRVILEKPENAALRDEWINRIPMGRMVSSLGAR